MAPGQYSYSYDWDVVPVHNNVWTRPDLPFATNGGSNWIAQSSTKKQAPASMAQVSKNPDIANRNMGAWEYPFTSGMDVVPVQNNPWTRPELAYDNNGGSNWGSFAQKKQNPDIAERNMDGNVHSFDSGLDVVPAQHNPWTRPDLPYSTNGGSNWGSFAQSQIGAEPRKDIANKEVRPDVYVTVHKLINPVAMGRFREPRPDEAPVERTWDDGPAPKEAPKPEFKFKKPEEVDEEA